MSLPSALPSDPLQRETRLESGVFAKRPLQIVRGSGSTLYDAAGNAYLDAGASYGTNHVGHAHPRVVRAIRDQSERLLHIPSTYPNDVRAAFLERLVAMAPVGLERAFLASTGTEAIECALKFARQATGRAGIVHLARSFHGRTYGALSATAKAQYRKPFGPLVPGFQQVRADDVEALKAAVTNETAALILEPVQGEGGVLPLSSAYLRAARDITADAGALLIADEVQTGLGRTGTFLAVEQAGVTPDLVCLGKGLGGGVPLSATLMTADVAQRQAVASHGTTFGGNPLACAAGLAVLGILDDEGLSEHAARHGAQLLDAWEPLRALAGVREVRGRGLMLGIELAGKPYPVLDELIRDGILALPAGATVVRLLPPLILTDSECRRLAAGVRSAVERHVQAAPPEEATA